MGWQCSAKLKGGQGISLNKFEISRVANESLFKLGMGEEGVATTWCKLVANKFLTHLNWSYRRYRNNRKKTKMWML
jgi:hypothetical protein